MRKVIVIGASSGIGLKLAEYYAFNGCLVGIAARREEKLQEIQQRHPDRVMYTVMDVTDASASKKYRMLVEKLEGVDLVIYCAGEGKHIRELDVEDQTQTVRVNVEGFLNIMIPAFNYFLRREGNHEYVPQLVTLSSVASIRGLGLSPAYSATKRFQNQYFESLAQLAHIRRIKIDFTVILPGFVDTGFIHRKYPMTMSREYAVKQIIRAVEKRKTRKVIDGRWGIVAFLMKLVPSVWWRKIRLG